MFCSDNITPLDGCTSRYTLWLPKKGDELVKSQFSSLTVRQDRIRSIKKFADLMKINMDTDKAISQSIDTQEWVSIPVIVRIKSKPYEGVIYNRVKKMERATS